MGEIKASETEASRSLLPSPSFQAFKEHHENLDPAFWFLFGEIALSLGISLFIWTNFTRLCTPEKILKPIFLSETACEGSTTISIEGDSEFHCTECRPNQWEIPRVEALIKPFSESLLAGLANIPNFTKWENGNIACEERIQNHYNFSGTSSCYTDYSIDYFFTTDNSTGFWSTLAGVTDLYDSTGEVIFDFKSGFTRDYAEFLRDTDSNSDNCTVSATVLRLYAEAGDDITVIEDFICSRLYRAFREDFNFASVAEGARLCDDEVCPKDSSSLGEAFGWGTLIALAVMAVALYVYRCCVKKKTENNFSAV